MIENYPSKVLYDLRQREGYWIRQLGSLNIVVAGRTQKEYVNENVNNYREKEHMNDKKYYDKIVKN